MACLVAVLLAGCEETTDDAPVAEERSAPVVSPQPPSAEQAAASEPNRAEPAEPEPAEVDAPAREPAPASRAVIHRVLSLGHHMVPGTRVIDAPWEVPGVVAEPGDETITALGRELEGCRTTELEHGRATWCPDIGVVTRRGRERSAYVEESLAVLRRGDETWATSPCDVMHLMGDEARASLCERPLRTLGVDPPVGRPPDPVRCRWRFTPDERVPSGQRHPLAVTVRLADVAWIEEWAGAEPGGSVVEGRRTRTWIARRGESAAAVRLRGDLCGDAEGGAFAEHLVALAPE